MTYTLQFISKIEEDVISSYVWYESKSRGLGEDFLRMFYACASAAQTISVRYLLYDIG
jgi:hypothetical protein